MHLNDQQAAQRAADHENLVGELVSVLKELVEGMPEVEDSETRVLFRARQVIAKAEGATA